MFNLSSNAFLIPKNIDLLQMAESGSIKHIASSYIISEQDLIQLHHILTKSIIYGNDLKDQHAIAIRGLMAILDLFKLYNIFIDNEMNLDISVKHSDFKTSTIIINIFKYIISKIDANVATGATGIKDIIIRLFSNKKKMLFSIFLIIIGVNNYEKPDYTFRTGGGINNCNNIANILYKLMHEFFFGSIQLHTTANKLKQVGRPKRKTRARSTRETSARSARETSASSTRETSARSTRETSARSARETSIGKKRTHITNDDIFISNKKIAIQLAKANTSDIFQHDSEIYQIPFLQNGKDLKVPFDIFDK